MNVALPDAIAVCESSGAPVATLHAAAGVRPLYARYGFLEIGPIHYGHIALHRESTGDSDAPSMRLASLDGDDLVRLMPLQIAFHRRLRIVGSVVRSEAAWRNLLPLSGPTHVLTGEMGAVRAYATVAIKGGVMKLADFGAAEDVEGAEALR